MQGTCFTLLCHSDITEDGIKKGYDWHRWRKDAEKILLSDLHLWLHVFSFQANKTKESPHGTCFPSTCIFIHQNRLNLCLHTSGVNKRCFSSLLSSCVVVDGAQTGLLSSLEYSSSCAREAAFAFPLLCAFFFNCILTRTSLQTGFCFAASCWLFKIWI